jgi:hypothetical protein
VYINAGGVARESRNCDLLAGDLTAEGGVELDFPVNDGFGEDLGVSGDEKVAELAVAEEGVFIKRSLLERCGDTTDGRAFV